MYFHRVGRVSVILLTLLFTGGAAEFPSFEEFVIEEAIDEEDFFEEEVSYEFGIPRVAERQYGAEEMKRLPVQAVVIRNVVPHEERGITQEQVQAVLERAFEDQRDIKLDDNGFTSRDYKEIGQYLREIKDRGSDPDLDDLRRLVEMVGTLETELGWITIEQLDQVALEVTNYYRGQGLILATAYIPAQEVTDGTVYIDVLEGTLGNVTVSNNEIYAANTISKAFTPEVGRAVTEEAVEGTLRRINDLPGVRVRGSFSPGQNTGETSLNLGVLDEVSWAANLLMDNHGSETTGVARAFATTQWLNVAGKGHRAMIGALRSEGPDSSTYGIFEYAMPVTATGRGNLKASVSSNEFSVAGFENLPDIIGETLNYALQGDYQVIRSRTLNLGWDVGYSVKDVLFKVGTLTTLSTDQLIETVSAGISYTQLWDELRLLANGKFGVDLGHLITGEVRGQSVDFNKIRYTANILKRFELYNWLTKNESPVNVVAKVNGQYTEYFLSAVEQFSLGGPNAVRSLGISDVSVDSGVYAGLEVFFNLPPIEQFIPFQLDPLKPFIFYDYAYGIARANSFGGGSDNAAEVKGYGIGFRVSWGDKGVINLIFARPLDEDFENSSITARGKERLYVDFSYRIH